MSPPQVSPTLDFAEGRQRERHAFDAKGCRRHNCGLVQFVAVDVVADVEEFADPGDFQ